MASKKHVKRIGMKMITTEMKKKKQWSEEGEDSD